MGLIRHKLSPWYFVRRKLVQIVASDNLCRRCSLCPAHHRQQCMPQEQNHRPILSPSEYFDAIATYTYLYFLFIYLLLVYKNTVTPFSQTPLISELYIYITNNLCKWRLGTRGAMF